MPASGIHRLGIQKITLDTKLRGKALADALARDLNGNTEHAKHTKK